jgi:hypothetical protein
VITWTGGAKNRIRLVCYKYAFIAQDESTVKFKRNIRRDSVNINIT